MLAFGEKEKTPPFGLIFIIRWCPPFPLRHERLRRSPALRRKLHASAASRSALSSAVSYFIPHIKYTKYQKA